MQIDADALMLQAVKDGIREGIKARLGGGYGSPLDELIRLAVARHGAAIQGLIGEAIAACTGCPEFRAGVADAIRAALAKQLVQKFGGELERAVNAMKSDPATRARITLAIEEIVRPKA
jgi:class 3 adenylate cyclase